MDTTITDVIKCPGINLIDMFRFLFLFLISIPFLNGQDSRFEFDGEMQQVFIAGTEGYACFRIPAIIKLKNNDLIAFAEGRKKGCSDTGDIDLVYKRSKDGGKTWSALQVIWDDENNTCGNPAPIVDHRTGNVILLCTWNLGGDNEKDIIAGQSRDTRRVFSLMSKNMGQRWTRPREITKKVKKNNWTWYATGPGSGLQIESGVYKGRMVVGCDHIEAKTKKYFSHSIFSDNGGKKWKLGGSSPRDQVNECEIAEIENGNLIINMRNYDRTKRTRQVAYSDDGGLSWHNQRHADELIEPICQGSMISYKNDLFFSNPASSEKRINLSVKWSGDGGGSWRNGITLHEGPSAYSDLVVIRDGMLGCLFEGGAESPYEHILFAKVLLK